MATLTWGGQSGDWSSPLDWRPFVRPDASDTLAFSGQNISIATLDAAVSVTNVVLAGDSGVTLLLRDQLTLSGRFTASGGTIDLRPHGIITGGTVDFAGATVLGSGGIVDNSVWVGAFTGGVTITADTVTDTERARTTNPFVLPQLQVAGAIALASGIYTGAAFSLDTFDSGVTAELDAAGYVVLGASSILLLSQDNPTHAPNSRPAGPSPIIGGASTLQIDGRLSSDAVLATIEAAGLVNTGSIELTNASVLSVTRTVLGRQFTWNETTAPTLVVSSPFFDNAGVIVGHGAALDILGSTFSNSGIVTLGAAVDVTAPVVVDGVARLGTITLSSSLDVAASVTNFTNTGTIAAGTIEFDGVVRLDALGTLRGLVIFAGTLDLGGGTLDAATLAAGTQYAVTGVIRNGTVLDGNGQVTFDPAAVTDNVTVITGPSLSLTDATGPGSVTLDATVRELDYRTTAHVDNLIIKTGARGITDRIVIDPALGNVTLDATSTIVQQVAGATLDVTGGILTVDGNVTLDAGDMSIATLAGAGTITLADNAMLKLGAIASGAHVSIAFGAGNSALILPSDGSGQGLLGLLLTGLDAGDLIDFQAISANPGTINAEPGAVLANGAIRIQGTAGDQAAIATTASRLPLLASADPNGGTIVVVACFRGGTLIATTGGDRPVESLRVGDRVTTLSGPRPIRWIGRRSYAANLVAQQPQLRPVRIGQGALGQNHPRRPLDVSPLHGLFLGGFLVPAAALLDGMKIARAPIADVAYFHIELDDPAIIVAEGVPTESFVDCDNRWMFDNAAEYPQPPDPRRHRRFPVPRVEEGWQIEEVRWSLGLMARSAPSGFLIGNLDVYETNRIEGWAADEDTPTLPTELEILVDGTQADCIVANRYRPDLDRAGIGHGNAGFTCSLPLLARSGRVSVRRLRDGARLLTGTLPPVRPSRSPAKPGHMHRRSPPHPVHRLRKYRECRHSGQSAQHQVE